MLLFISENFPYSEVCSIALKSEINIAILAFFRLILAWYIFLHPFTFKIYMSVYLKWVSGGQYITGSCSLILSDNLCLSLGIFATLMCTVIIDIV